MAPQRLVTVVGIDCPYGSPCSSRTLAAPSSRRRASTPRTSPSVGGRPGDHAHSSPGAMRPPPPAIPQPYSMPPPRSSRRADRLITLR